MQFVNHITPLCGSLTRCWMIPPSCPGAWTAWACRSDHFQINAEAIYCGNKRRFDQVQMKIVYEASHGFLHMPIGAHYILLHSLIRV
jgi:hypothetical protein